MSRATLIGHGRKSWPEARELLDGHRCAWADLDGFTVGAAPEDPPLATVLWAWNDTSLLRLRIDGPEAVIGQLDLTGDEVDVTVRTSRTWPAGEGRVSVADQWRDLPVVLYEVAGLMPLTFARLDQP
ncbi:hypothetical protein GCM10027589_00230 [Actinocorallia lasiicapitis]